MQRPLFITGIGTDVGKTVASAIITQALGANYWKPIQAGFDTGTDATTVAGLVTNANTQFFPEVYKLSMPASPHIAAKAENEIIDIDAIANAASRYCQYGNPLVVEGAGGLMVPVNNEQFVADIIWQLNAQVILVSRNYLGSINHSLLTAMACKQMGLDVLGWVFNDQYLSYENDIADWSGYPIIGRIPHCQPVTANFVAEQAALLRPALIQHLGL
jgi:dethiobiotin synthetase